ncbi:MAG: SH3 domain-containing protein [Saprospiraceae bacterium]|nr:SH3 domain-containing protein [Saprospiraceae bacterium]
MKFFGTTLLTICLLTSIIAQESDPNNWMQCYGSNVGFEVGNRYYSMVSDANLREKPNTQSAVLTKLPIGASVEMLKVAGDSFTLRGVTLPWVQVRTSVGGKSFTGYIWGGFLALASIQTPNDEYTPNAGVLYLTGVAAYDEAKHLLTVQVRAAKDGKELSKCEFTTNGDLSYYPEFAVRFEPFQKVKAVLTVNYYYPACGYPAGDNVLFWLENNQMVKVLETTSISDGGVFYSSEDYLMPSDKGGIGDHILVVRDQSEFEEQGENMVRSSQKYSLSLYKWNGSKLSKLKDWK